jgi:hypothetical protein
MKDEIEDYLQKMADDLEPKTHCCECTKGPHYDVPHFVHIQYPNCKCDPKNYVLRKNE